MTRIYLAKMSYNSVNIASVEVVKETDKSYMVDRKTEEQIRGYVYIPRRIDKGIGYIYHSFEEAQTNCLRKLEESARSMEANLIRMQQRIAAFKKEIGASEDQEGGATPARDPAGIATLRAEDQTEGDRQTDSGG